MTEPTERPVTASGHCLCGAVRYTARGPLRPVLACHCNECRRFSGGVWNATGALRDRIAVEDPEGLLAWYAFSDRFRRGFCSRCGSGLFIDNPASPALSISMGSLDKPTGLKLALHMWTPDAGDYYEIADGVPTIPGHDHPWRDPATWAEE